MILALGAVEVTKNPIDSNFNKVDEILYNVSIVQSNLVVASSLPVSVHRLLSCSFE
jgi:hypothetical protein